MRCSRSRRARWRARRRGDGSRYLFVEYKTGEHELYDLQRDPYELNNVYDRAPKDLVATLNSRLDSLRQCEAEGCRAAEGD